MKEILNQTLTRLSALINFIKNTHIIGLVNNYMIIGTGFFILILVLLNLLGGDEGCNCGCFLIILALLGIITII